MISDGSIKYGSMSLGIGTAEDLVAGSKSKIPLELENEKAWQPSSEPCN